MPKFRGLEKAKENFEANQKELSKKTFIIYWTEYDKVNNTYINQTRNFKALNITKAKEHITECYDVKEFEVYDNKGTKLFTEEDI